MKIFKDNIFYTLYLHRNLIINPFFCFKNWWIFYLDYFKKVNKKSLKFYLRNGIQFYGEAKKADSLVINEIWGMEVYNPLLFEINVNDIVVDIGAHKGYFSVYASKKAKNGKVFSFEPMAFNLSMLKKNIKINNCKNISYFNMGIGGSNEKKRFYVSIEGTAGVTVIHDWFRGEHKKESFFNARVITLKDVFSICRISKIDFLKIDCEGAEYEIILQSPKSVLKKINKISMEFHQINNLRVEMLRKSLEKNNFEVKISDPNATIGLLYATNKNIKLIDDRINN